MRPRRPVVEGCVCVFFIAGKLAFLKAQISPPKKNGRISGENETHKSKNTFGNGLTGVHRVRVQKFRMYFVSLRNGVDMKFWCGKHVYFT